jgi:hypothetical protein
MFYFKAGLALGAGLEYRYEKLEIAHQTTNYGRTWARVNLGFSIPSPVIKPFIGVEAAFPLSNTTTDVNGSPDEQLKGIAPKREIGIYAGLRF